MAAMNNFTELDFAKLKQNLINFLKTQDQFKDYDFAGSAMNVLIDLLVYNTQYNAFYSNMVANDMFLDTAILRESVVSRAKAIGYKPHSRKSSIATIKLSLTILSSPPTSILIPQWTKFVGVGTAKNYFFYNTQSIVLTNNGSGVFSGQLDIIEGSLLTFSYIVDNTIIPKQRFIIPNQNVDTNTINIKVNPDTSSPIVESFFLADDINVVSSTTPAFWVQEVEDQKYEIFFGDGVVGKSVVNGNVINIQYILSSGSNANNIKTFNTTSSISGYSGFTFETISPSKDGVEIESNESVKFLAPLFYETQNRAVNKHDYETLIKKDYPQIEFIRVWGGEENNPPIYGKVFIAAKPYGALAFSEQEKLSILNSIVKPRSPVSIESIIVEPDYLQVIVTSQVNYKSKNTTLTAGDIQNNIENAIKQYRDTNLIGFDTKLRYSQLVQTINAADQSIVSNLTKLKLKYTITPPINIATRIDIQLNAQIDKGDAQNNISAINSTGFIKDGLISYLGDDGIGNLYIYRLVLSTKVIVEKNVGTVDYTNGHIIIPSFLIQGIANGEENINLLIDPAIPDLTPIKNQVLVINDYDILVTLIDEDA